MRLFRSFTREFARPVGACLVVFATWAVLDRTVLTQAPAPAPPAGGTAAPQAPPAGGGRAGDPTPPAGGRGGGRGRGELSPFAKEALAVLRAPLDRLTPVTDAMLRNPPPGDWLHWRRTYDGWAHSPLTQINRDTVKNLKVAWTWSLNSGTGAVNEFTPLVHDGIMFMWNFGETIQALDAKTGTLLWQYTHAAAGRLPVAAGVLQDEAEPRDRRQQAHRPDDRHACHCAGRQDGRQVVGCRHRRLQEPAHLQQRPARHQGQGARRRRQLLARAREFNEWDLRRSFPAGRMLHHRPRSRDRKATVAIQHDRPGGRAWRRHLEQPAEREARRWRHLGGRAVRPGAEPDVLGHRVALAVVDRHARHLRREGALHELHAGAQSRHRQARLALPAYRG